MLFCLLNKIMLATVTCYFQHGVALFHLLRLLEPRLTGFERSSKSKRKQPKSSLLCPKVHGNLSRNEWFENCTCEPGEPDEEGCVHPILGVELIRPHGGSMCSVMAESKRDEGSPWGLQVTQPRSISGLCNGCAAKRQHAIRLRNNTKQHLCIETRLANFSPKPCSCLGRASHGCHPEHPHQWRARFQESAAGKVSGPPGPPLSKARFASATVQPDSWCFASTAARTALLNSLKQTWASWAYFGASSAILWPCWGQG